MEYYCVLVCGRGKLREGLMGVCWRENRDVVLGYRNGNREFPALHDLSIDDCPKLVGKFPENLCSLTELRTSRCPELNLETPIQLSILKRFEVDGSRKAGVLFDEAELFASQLDGMKQIEELSICYCNSLTSYPTSILSNDVIVYCRMQKAKEAARMYAGSRCPEIESFPNGGLPFNLQFLSINNCEKLVNGRKKWRLQRLSSLRDLYIYHDGSDEEIVGGENWELPCSIQRLIITNLKALSSRLLKSLTSLEYLWTCNLPQIQSLLEQGLPSSLSELYLYDHDELHSLPTEGLRHLTSLRRLQIKNCPNLQSLPESALPSSLSVLTIEDCPNLQSVPVKWISSSLSKLSIYKCSLLEPLLEFDKGEYWPEIAHIPEIYMGGCPKKAFECTGSSLETEFADMGIWAPVRVVTVTCRILLSSGNAESPIEYPSINNHSAWSMVEFLGTVIQESCGAAKGVSVTSGIGGFLVIKVSRRSNVTSGSNWYFDHSIDSFLPVRACCHAGTSRDVDRLNLLLDFSDQFFATITLITGALAVTSIPNHEGAKHPYLSGDCLRWCKNLFLGLPDRTWFYPGYICLGLSGGELCFALNSGTIISCWRLNNFPSRDAVWVWKYDIHVSIVVKKCREDFGLGGGNALGFEVRNMVFHPALPDILYLQIRSKVISYNVKTSTAELVHDFGEAWRMTVHYKLFSYEWPQWPRIQ
ncbi:hypothetical protein FXO37_06684 [Capsicum annuum]|nr:hypothetical protein FXO37_06684 [Capsicum annuum]